MNLEIAYRDMGSTDAIRDHIEQRASKLAKYVREDEHVRVIVGTEANHHVHFAEIYWHDNASKKDYFARKEGDYLYTQIDEVFETILGQIKKIHDRKVATRHKRVPLKKAAGKASKDV